MNYSMISQIVADIMEYADEILRHPDKSDIDRGQLIACAEALCIIQDAYSGYDLSKLGLDFDVDEKYIQ